MESAFKILTTNRTNYSVYLEKYTLEQLNTIPSGFSNNLIWNIAHIIVIQQRLYYKGSGLPMNISDELFERYKPGTKPTATTTQTEVGELKGLLFSLTEKTKNDFDEGKFTSYTSFKTLTGFQIDSFKDAIQFNNYHEALHLGFMTNIKKFV